MGPSVTNLRIWSSLSSLELVRLLRQQPFKLFRLAVMALIVGVLSLAYYWTGPKSGFSWRDLKELGPWLLVAISVALHLAIYFCLPLLMSTALLERGAESPTMLLRLSRLSGRGLLIVKLTAGVGAFVFACLPVAPLLGMAVAVSPISLFDSLIVALFLLWTIIHVGFIVLAFSVSSTRAADAYRRSLFAFLMLMFIPFAAPGNCAYFIENFPGVPWWVFLALNVWFSLYLPWLALNRAGEQLDSADDLVGMKVTPPEEVQASAPIEWAQWIFGRFLLLLFLGCTIPFMSFYGYYLQDKLWDAYLARWLFFQIPATLLLVAALTLRLTFSNYFEPSGAMYLLLLAAPTSPAWWFVKLLFFRSKLVLWSAAFFVAAGFFSIGVDPEVGVPLWGVIVVEVLFTTLWVFALTLVCKPRFMALAAIAFYGFLAYVLPWLLPPDRTAFSQAVVATAAVTTALTLFWPHPAAVVLQAASYYHCRFLAAPLLEHSPGSMGSSFAMFDYVLSGAFGTRTWWIGLPGKEPLANRVDASVVQAVFIGDLVMLAAAAVWLWFAFDVMIGRSAFRPFRRLFFRSTRNGRAVPQ